MPDVVILLGRPGAGKTTQFERLHDAMPGALPVSFGTLARAFAEGDSADAGQARTHLTEGKRLPDALGITILSAYLRERLKPRQPILLEGTPRHVLEARALDSFFDSQGYARPVLVLNIELPEHEAVNRVYQRADSREDDRTEESIRNRQEWYAAETLPMLEWMKAHTGYEVVDIDGTAAPDAVAEAIRNAVSSRYEKGAPQEG